MRIEEITIFLSDVTVDNRLQPRESLDADVIEEYAERYAEAEACQYADGEPLPPVRLVRDGKTMWLADGFHRFHAALKAKREYINAEVSNGQFRDALLIAAGANATHGLRRTNADKRRAVEMLLGDAECAAWSNREIARHCLVDESVVRSARTSICGNPVDDKVDAAHDASTEFPQIPATPATRTVTRNGKTYQMNVGNIGKRPAGYPGPRGFESIRPVEAPRYSAEGLLPCPFCGGDAQLAHGEREGHMAVCRDAVCNAIGPRCPEKDKARSGWNRRANDGETEDRA